MNDDNNQEIWRIRRVRGRLEALNAMHIAQGIAESHGITVADMLGRSSRSHIARARRQLWTLVRHTLGMTYRDVGALFDVDHTAVHAAVRRRELELEVICGGADMLAKAR